jgi:hypothetical protein
MYASTLSMCVIRYTVLGIYGTWSLPNLIRDRRYRIWCDNIHRPTRIVIHKNIEKFYLIIDWRKIFLKFFLSRVSFHMQWEMITSSKGPVTQVTLERFAAGMLAVVASQLIWAGKPPPAPIPGAGVRLLTRVGPLVCLQVGALCIYLKQ